VWLRLQLILIRDSCNYSNGGNVTCVSCFTLLLNKAEWETIIETDNLIMAKSFNDTK